DRGARRDARARERIGARAPRPRRRRGRGTRRRPLPARRARRGGASRCRGGGASRGPHRGGEQPSGPGRTSARVLPSRGRRSLEGITGCRHGGGAPAPAGWGWGAHVVMLYLLLYPLHVSYAPLNVFKYITFRTLLAGLTALTLSLLLGPPLIRRLAALQIGQSIRDDGPAAHASKAGTPTMGGTLILISFALATLLLPDLNDWYVWIALGVTLGHGGIGFLDDYAKV